MNVFLTGGTGLVGRHAIVALRRKGHRITALSRSDASDADLRALGVEPLRGDLRDGAVLERGVAGSEAVVHAGAIVVSRGDWPLFESYNVAPTATIARAAARRGCRMIHLSSVSVYGRATTYDGGAGSVTEDFGLDRPMFPGDHYARSKREAELVLWRSAQNDGLSAVALRPCVIYGEGDRAFGTRVARLARRGVAPLIGSGANTLSVVYAGNVAAAVLAAVEQPRVTGAFNVANDGVITQRAFVERFAAGMGVRLRLVPVPLTLAWYGARAVDRAQRLVRPAQTMTLLKSAVQWLASENPYRSLRAETELGWRPVVPPDRAVEQTGRWHRDHTA